jgi:hypothetical protein
MRLYRPPSFGAPPPAPDDPLRLLYARMKPPDRGPFAVAKGASDKRYPPARRKGWTVGPRPEPGRRAAGRSCRCRRPRHLRRTSGLGAGG